MLTDFLRRVQDAGLRIDHVYDIGACDGAWSLAMRSRVLPHASFFLFEANPACAHSLGRTGLRSYCGAALSNPGRSQVEFFNGTNTGDSYYKETTRFYDRQGSITLPCTTLDELKRADRLPTPQFSRNRQFIPIDIFEIHRAEHTLVQVDILFLRKESKERLLGPNDFIRPLAWAGARAPRWPGGCGSCPGILAQGGNPFHRADGFSLTHMTLGAPGLRRRGSAASRCGCRPCAAAPRRLAWGVRVVRRQSHPRPCSPPETLATSLPPAVGP